MVDSTNIFVDPNIFILKTSSVFEVIMYLLYLINIIRENKKGVKKINVVRSS